MPTISLECRTTDTLFVERRLHPLSLQFLRVSTNGDLVHSISASVAKTASIWRGKLGGIGVAGAMRILFARPPISLKMIRYEPFMGRWHEMPWVAEQASREGLRGRPLRLSEMWS